MKIFEKVIVPDNVDLYIIGDLHGDRDGFHRKLKEYNVKEEDHVIVVGDIADRGPKIVPLFFDFLNKPNYHMVLGNHEQFLLDYRDRANFVNWTTGNNGGDKTLDQMGLEGIKFFAEQIAKKVPLIMEVHHRGKVFGIVHAAIPLFYDEVPVNKWQDIIKKAKKEPEYAEQLMWDRYVIDVVAKQMYEKVMNERVFKRDDFRANLLNNPDVFYTVKQEDLAYEIPRIEGINYVIHGHTGVFAPVAYENMLWIDTKFATGYFTLLNFNNIKDKWDAYFLANL